MTVPSLIKGTTTKDRGPSIGRRSVRGSLTQSLQIWLVWVRTAAAQMVSPIGTTVPALVGVSPATARTMIESEVGCDAMAPEQPRTDTAVSASNRKMISGSGGAQARIRWASMTACS
jgi:hypothetical protein